MAPTSFIKLANKLPRISLPTAKPNGAAPNWSLDPYLETTVNGSPWIQGNASFVNAKSTKDNGIWSPAGGSYQGPFQQSFTMGYGIPKIYFEIEELKGVAWVFDSETVITSPGAYIIEQGTQSPSSIAFYFADSYFTPYPSFGNLPEGQIPLYASGDINWKEYGIPATRKLSNGRVAINMDAAPINNIGITYNSEWPLTANSVAEIVVDYLPPGGVLRFYHGDRTVDTISAPGRYSYVMSWTAPGGVRPALTNNTRVQGEAIVSRFMIKAASQPWSIEGNLFAKPTCLWIAERNVFDAIVSPKYQVSSNQYSRDNLASAIQPNIPQLGYCGYLPPAGMYRVGDTIYNPSGSPSGWRCVQAGNPGVWAPLPTL